MLSMLVSAMVTATAPVTLFSEGVSTTIAAYGIAKGVKNIKDLKK